MEQPDKTSKQADVITAEQAAQLCKRLADPTTTDDERDAIQGELLNYGLARIFAD